MVQPSQRWRNLGIAAGGTAAVLFAVFDLYQWISAWSSDHFHNDFTFYYVAAQIGWQHGWRHIYDLELQQAYLNTLGSGITVAQLARYISPPPVAWAALPLTILPYTQAYAWWSGFLLVALGVTWRFAAPGPGSGRLRELFLAAAIGWLPVIYGLQLGQPGLFVALGVAGSYALVRSGHSVWAGVALGAIVFKPQLAFLVPLALLASRQYRAFFGSVIAVGAIGIVSVLALGAAGTSAYLDRLSFAAAVPVNRDLTLTYLIGGASRPAEIFIAAWTMLIANRIRGRGVEWVYAVALVGGMLATPYVHLDDLMMLGLAAWLVLRASPPTWSWAYILALVIAVEGEPIWGPAPVLVAELGALILLSAAALRSQSRDALTLPQIDARHLELRPKQ